MKNCPFCAEEIQDEAIKCKHCGEFLDPASMRRTAEQQLPWYFRSSFLVVAILCVGPFALPLLWFRPRTSWIWKVVLSILILGTSWFFMWELMGLWHQLSQTFHQQGKQVKSLLGNLNNTGGNQSKQDQQLLRQAQQMLKQLLGN